MRELMKLLIQISWPLYINKHLSRLDQNKSPQSALNLTIVPQYNTGLLNYSHHSNLQAIIWPERTVQYNNNPEIS